MSHTATHDSTFVHPTESHSTSKEREASPSINVNRQLVDRMMFPINAESRQHCQTFNVVKLSGRVVVIN